MKFPNDLIKPTLASDRASFFMEDSMSAWLIIHYPGMDINNEKIFHGVMPPMRTYIIRDSFEKVVLPEIDLVKKELTFKHICDQDELWIDGTSYEIRSENTATESDPEYQWWLE